MRESPPQLSRFWRYQRDAFETRSKFGLCHSPAGYINLLFVSFLSAGCLFCVLYIHAAVLPCVEWHYHTILFGETNIIINILNNNENPICLPININRHVGFSASYKSQIQSFPADFFSFLSTWSSRAPHSDLALNSSLDPSNWPIT